MTRERVKIDRGSCLSLLRGFPGPAAEFLFVPHDEMILKAKRPSAIPFDMEGMEVGHHDGKCSFEAIVTNTKNMVRPRVSWQKLFTALMVRTISAATPKPQA